MGKTVPSKPSIRNLQSIKGGSFTITLPRWWVAKRHLLKGSRFFVAEDGSSLRLTPMQVIGEMRRVEIELDALDNPQSVRYLLWTYYMQGANEIKVKSRDVIPAEVKRMLREVRLDLPAIEVIDESAQVVVFGVVGEEGGRRLDESIGDIQNVALSVHRDAIDAVAKANVPLASEVIGRGVEILRRYRAMIRKLAICSMNSEVAYACGIKDSRELITYALLARDLNRTVYHAVYMARHMIKFGGEAEGEVLRILKSMSNTACSMQKLAMEGFLEKNYSKVLRVITLMAKIRDLDDSLSKRILSNTMNTKKSIAGMLIAREIRRIAGYSVAMADVA